MTVIDRLSRMPLHRMTQSTDPNKVFDCIVVSGNRGGLVAMKHPTAIRVHDIAVWCGDPNDPFTLEVSQLTVRQIIETSEDTNNHVWVQWEGSKAFWRTAVHIDRSK